MGAHTTVKERQLVINHFNNGNSLREIPLNILLRGIKRETG
jgi:hypothetical protein